MVLFVALLLSSLTADCRREVYHHCYHYQYVQCFSYFLTAWRQTAAEKIPDVQQASAISPPDDIVIS